jgi:hypothetical protein
MKRVLITLMLAFTVLLVNCNAQPNPNQSAKGPKLEIIGGDSYDWGKVSPKDDPLKAVVVLKNTGDDTLVISEVKPACGCTNAPLYKTKLFPGDTTALNITLRIGTSAHELSKTVRITSNDPVNANKILVLKANVFHPVQVSPNPYFAFNTMKVGQEASSELKIKNNTEKAVTLSKFEITPEGLVINLKDGQTIKPGEEISIIAKYKPSKTGYFNCSVKMKTSSEEMPELFISGYGNVQESAIFNN